MNIDFLNYDRGQLIDLIATLNNDVEKNKDEKTVLENEIKHLEHELSICNELNTELSEKLQKMYENNKKSMLYIDNLEKALVHNLRLKKQN